MHDIHKTVREDWGEITRLAKEAYTDIIRMAAESSGLKPMTLEEFQARYPNQAIPISSDRVFLITDIESSIPHIRYHKLASIFEGYQRHKAEALVERLFGLYSKSPNLFQSEFDRVMDDARRRDQKALANYLKQAGSRLKQLENLRHEVKTLPKQVTGPLDTAISGMTESIAYASAMRKHLASLPTAPSSTSKGSRRKSITSHSEWNKPIVGTVKFFFRPETGIKKACTDTAALFQVLFPAAWAGAVPTLGDRIYQRYYKLTNPI